MGFYWWGAFEEVFGAVVLVIAIAAFAGVIMLFVAALTLYPFITFGVTLALVLVGIFIHGGLK